MSSFKSTGFHTILTRYTFDMQTRVSKRLAENGGAVGVESELRGRCHARVAAANIEFMTSSVGRKRTRYSRVRLSTARTAQDEDSSTFSTTRLHGKRKRLSYEKNAMLAAAIVVVRFMRKFATPLKTLKVLVSATLPSSRTGASKGMSTMLGHRQYTTRVMGVSTVRAMRRFINRAGLFHGMKDYSSHMSVFATRILRCFDVCGCTESYRPNGKCVSVEYSTKVFTDLVQAASTLEYLFTKARQRVLAQTSSTSPLYTSGERMELCTHLYKFDKALSVWRQDTSFELQERTRNVLFNIYDTVSVLHTGMAQSKLSCVPKPFIEARVLHYKQIAKTVERRFLNLTCMFNGSGMLEKMKALYHDQRQHSSDNVIAVSSVADLATVGEVVATSELEMKRVLHSLRSYDTYTADEVHHESVLDISFDIKHCHLGRDDVCIQGALRLYNQGRVDTMRLQMNATETHGGVRVYRCAMLAIVDLRDHLKELGLHSHSERVLSVLDVDRLKHMLDTGTLSWAYVVSILNMAIYAMRHCVGNKTAREVRYKKRSYDAMKEQLDNNNSTILTGIASTNSCVNLEGVLLARPRAYSRLLRNTNAMRLQQGGVRRVLDSNGDSMRFGLDRGPYVRLKQRIKDISNANNTHTEVELGSLFCDTLEAITDELCKLDVSLANADIDAVRSAGLSTAVVNEQKNVSQWFQSGLGVTNTLAWLQKQNGSSMAQRVFCGYMSLIMGETSLELDEMHYPEVVVLDISYIHKARGVFYGQVAQATILVIIGQRLADAGINGVSINKCLTLLSVEPTFVAFGLPETCRQSKDVQDCLRDTTRDVLNMLSGSLGVSDTTRDLILREVRRETAHYQYPTSHVASSIARKWTAATAKAIPDERGHSPHVFSSPETTCDGFSSCLMLPNAAVFLSRDFHFSTVALVHRVAFNLAVHSERYRGLAHKLKDL